MGFTVKQDPLPTSLYHDDAALLAYDELEDFRDQLRAHAVVGPATRAVEKSCASRETN